MPCHKIILNKYDLLRKTKNRKTSLFHPKEAMKKIFSFFVMVALSLHASKAAFAVTEWHADVYIAPKLSRNLVIMNSSYGTVFHPASGTAMYDIKTDGSDVTVGGALAVGYDFSRTTGFSLRTEIEYGYMPQVETKGRGNNKVAQDFDAQFEFKLDIQTVFINSYFDFDVTPPFKPYIGVGAGIAILKQEASILQYHNGVWFGGDALKSGTQTNFAWNAGAGITWEVTSSFAVDLGYRT